MARLIYGAAWKGLSNRKKIVPIATATQQDELIELGLMTPLQAERCTRAEAKRLLGKAKGPQPKDPAIYKEYSHTSTVYQKYIKSAEWFVRRAECLKRANHICQVCKKNRATDAHHLTYVRFMDEKQEDLQAVCRECHRIIHGEA